MARAVADFRDFAFDLARVDRAAKSVGRDPYWRLYAAENVVRVVIHSVLSIQVGVDWWVQCVDTDIQKQAERFQQRYLASPWHSFPGSHQLYFVYLRDLSEIMRANSNLFLPIIADVDAWIARIEQVVVPRNIVGHMNWPNQTDRRRIAVFYSDIRVLATHLARKGLALTIP